MPNFAVIDKDNIVINIIVAESLLIAQDVLGLTCIEYDDSAMVAIGGIYDSKTKTFINPEIFSIDSES